MILKNLLKNQSYPCAAREHLEIGNVTSELMSGQSFVFVSLDTFWNSSNSTGAPLSIIIATLRP